MLPLDYTLPLVFKFFQQGEAFPHFGDLSSSLYCLEYPLNVEASAVDWGFLIEWEDKAKQTLFNASCKELSPSLAFLKKATEVDLFKRYGLENIAFGLGPQASLADLFVYCKKNASPSLALFAEAYALTGKKLSPQMEAFLSSHFPSKDYRLQHLGFLYGRKERGLRLNFKARDNITPQELYAVFQKMRIPGLEENLLHFLNEMSPFFNAYAFGIDLEEGPKPRVGIKCSFDYQTASEKNKKWDEIFHYLERRGLCLPGKKERLQQWQGGTIAYDYLYRRTLDFIKFIYENGALTMSKAYLKTTVHPYAI